MVKAVTLPQLTETMEEATLIRWLKQPGEKVEKHTPLYEVETDKTTMEVESVDTGYLCQIKIREGETVAVGTELATIVDAMDECSQPLGHNA
jgi:pyruvate/2-oxoglutarate dehydrogenase complex dihydrolipoamide acyltransferase (E2) component